MLHLFLTTGNRGAQTAEMSATQVGRCLAMSTLWVFHHRWWQLYARGSVCSCAPETATHCPIVYFNPIQPKLVKRLQLSAKTCFRTKQRWEFSCVPHHRIYAITITFSIWNNTRSVNMPSGVSEPSCVTFGSVQFSGEKLLQMPMWRDWRSTPAFWGSKMNSNAAAPVECCSCGH